MADSKVHLIKAELKNELSLIEYPGLIKSDENMLKTLGGISKISQTFSDKKKRMEIKFHPDNVYSKPLYGDVRKTVGLLLKVKIRKPKNPHEPANHIVEILGKCKKVAKFETLCDYQYLPILRNPETAINEYMYDEIVPPGVPTQEWFDERSNQPLLCLPSIFSRNDSVAQNLHRGVQKNNLSNDVIGVVRNKNIDSVESVPFNLTDSFPTKPDPKVLKRLTIKYVSDSDLERVRKCFEECPIWNRISLIYESKVSHDKLKCILPSVAYYFGTGPWRTMYIRYGYDPRKNFESRLYQTFDWRMRKEYGLNELINLKRMQNETSRSTAGPSTSQGTTDLQGQGNKYPYLENGKLPSARQCLYRYCDLHFPKIKELLERIPSPITGATCNEKLGWLPLRFEEECRDIIWHSITELTKTLRQKKNDENQQDIYDEEEYFDEDEEDYGNEEEESYQDDANDDELMYTDEIAFE